MFSLRTAEETPEAFHLKCVYAFLCPALVYVEEAEYSECCVEFNVGLQADVSALPDGVKS